jgi:chromosome segregation ATPase
MSLNRLSSDIAKLIAAGATPDDIQDYLEEEGVKVDEHRNFVVQCGRYLADTQKQIKSALESVQEASAGVAIRYRELTGELETRIKASEARITKQLESGKASLSNEVERLGPKVKAVIAENLPDIPNHQKQIDGLTADIDVLRSDVANLTGLVEKLVKARRVPVRDKEGVLIGVDLKLK